MAGRPLGAAALVVLLPLLLSLVLAGRDFYDLLQVPKGASDQQIKRAYRKLALQYHPDKVQGTEQEKEAAAKKFAEIGSAYEVLSNEEKRRIYDRYGEEGLKQHDQQGGGGGGAADIFSQFFGGGFGFGGFGGEEEEQTPKGNDVYVELEVSLRDLYLGNTFKVVRDKNVLKPGKGKRRCKCKNKMTTRQIGPGMFQQYTTQECEQCDNVRFVREAETLNVSVEPGMKDGEHITFFEEGEPMIDGEPGDLKFVVRTRPDKRFVRRGNDLLYNMTIPLESALIGFKDEIEHLDGHKVPLHLAGVTIPGQVVTLRGEGMPLPDQAHKHGDLHVTFTIAFPQALSEQQKVLVKQLGKEWKQGTVHQEL
ncbi:hypothetical protein WJX72_009416 [[Myrmecia] bisecta]|uniref:J domain-containing protein n=1 Tax=[Myrmecia] bisecta TaxID=41462 RepID=A0AAW1QSR9_9CHLO